MKEKKSVKEFPFLFIIGSPRSGTTWLNNMIGLHSEVASIGNIEINLWNKYIASLFEHWQKESAYTSESMPHGMPGILSEREFQSMVFEIINSTYSKFLERNNSAAIILDKVPLYSYHLPLISKMLPNAKFLHIVRDGRDVAVSMFNASKKLSFAPTDGGNAATMWREHVEHSIDFGKQHPEKYMEVRYEKLLINKLEILAQIFDFINIDNSEKSIIELTNKGEFEKKVSVNNEKVNAIRTVKGAIWKSELGAVDRYLFHRHSKDLLFKLGYEKDTTWWKFSFMDNFKVAFFHLKNKLTIF